MTSKEFTMIANLISKSMNIKCIQNKNKNDFSWKANPVDKIIYYPQSDNYLDSDLGYLIHEVGHLRFSQPMSKIESGTNKKFIDWIEKFGKPAEQIFNLINSLEDVRIERKMKSVYKGANSYLKLAYKQSLKYDKTTNKNMQLYDSNNFKNFCGLKWLHYCKYFLWTEALGRNGGLQYLRRWNVEKEVHEAIAKRSNIIKEIIKCENTQELCNYIKDNILKIYLPLCDNEDAKKNRQKMKDFEKHMKGMMKDFIKLIKDIKLKIKKGEKGGKKTKVKVIQKMRMDGKLTEKLKLEKEAVQGLGEFNKRKWEGDPFKLNKLESLNGLTKKEIIETVKNNSAATKKAVSILKDMNIERYEGNYESGKLQNRKLYKIKTGQTKIFTKKVADVKSSKDLVFAILVDQSGSMSDRFMSDSRDSPVIRIQEAALSAAILSNALESCSKPFAIYGFNAKFFIHKEFNKKLDIKEIQEMVENVSRVGAGFNNDGYAINRTIGYLKKRPERNKVLIVISDGQPVPSGGRDEKGIPYDEYDLKEEVERAEKTAKVYGVGIQLEAVKRYYGRNIVLSDVSFLGKELIKIFKENIGKRKR